MDSASDRRQRSHVALLEVASDEMRARVQGLKASVLALSSIIAPLLVAEIYARMGATATFNAAGCIALLGAVPVLIAQVVISSENDDNNGAEDDADREEGGSSPAFINEDTFKMKPRGSFDEPETEAQESFGGSHKKPYFAQRHSQPARVIMGTFAPSDSSVLYSALDNGHNDRGRSSSPLGNRKKSPSPSKGNLGSSNSPHGNRRWSLSPSKGSLGSSNGKHVGFRRASTLLNVCRPTVQMSNNVRRRWSLSPTTGTRPSTRRQSLAAALVPDFFRPNLGAMPSW